jgi:hypothetical protein
MYIPSQRQFHAAIWMTDLSGSLTTSKRIQLGTQPLTMSVFQSNGAQSVMVCCDRPAVLHASGRKLVFANVNSAEVDPFTLFTLFYLAANKFSNSLTVQGGSHGADQLRFLPGLVIKYPCLSLQGLRFNSDCSLAFVSREGLVIGQMDDLQRLQTTTFQLGSLFQYAFACLTADCCFDAHTRQRTCLSALPIRAPPNLFAYSRNHVSIIAIYYNYNRLYERATARIVLTA